jgi:ParB family chromosome partitioning protein
MKEMRGRDAPATAGGTPALRSESAMTNASNAAVAGEKMDADKVQEKHDKVVEKRRALGRGLESLLPGPRSVTPMAHKAEPAPSAHTLPPSASASAAPAPPQAGATATAAANEGAPAVIGELQASGETVEGELIYQIPLSSIDLNPYQTRQFFKDATLEELADSIRTQGVIQPIVVRPGKEAGRYILILGERRMRASRVAGLEKIPAIVRRVSEQQAAEMTIVENLQRQDLNCIEQAEAFATMSTRFHLTQQQIGDRVGLSRAAVSNYMRLLSLGDGIVGALINGKLTFSHARLLLMVENPEHRWKLAQRAMEEKMSVLKLESLVIGPETPKEAGEGQLPKNFGRWVDPNVKAAQRSLEEILGMRVRIRDRNGRGRIQIDYSSVEDYERVVKMLRGVR